ncbi:CoA pyrophosphatase [Thalassotalea sp. PLHSN55]|uniref:CoA pyrophosphatase n=1 Tax=Thalassotalea sp. PLHSN55 TaxID=3435888 RepID=UPI003F879853
MTKNEFLQRFQLRPLENSAHLYKHDGKVRQAAVLIPLIDNHNQALDVLFTKRAAHLKHHPGQVSFPGGKVEPSDKNLIDTALRESYEEIGLPADAISIVGQLKSYHTISGYIVTPIVAVVSKAPEYEIDHNEVSEVFHVPLTHFLNTQNHIQVNAHFNGKHHPINYMPYQEHNIWGATASMLKDLASHLA